MKKQFITLIFVFVFISTAYAGYRFGLDTNNAQQDVKRHTLSLPSKTKNAWKVPFGEYNDLKGNKHKLSDWKGKLIILNFWASWCAPCQYEIRDFVQIQEEYKTKGLQIVGVGIDEKEKLQNVARSLGINYPVLVASLDDNPDLLIEWGNKSQIIPYTVVIDQKGIIQYIHRGQMTREDFDDFVKPYL